MLHPALPLWVPPTYGCHLKTGRLAAVASSSRVFGSVCAARTIALSTIKRGTPVVRFARLGQYAAALLVASSRLTVMSRIYSRSTNPSTIKTCKIPLANAASVPGVS